jgi:cobalt-zinc-cadmium efflux system outer membrane protein
MDSPLAHLCRDQRIFLAATLAIAPVGAAGAGSGPLAVSRERAIEIALANDRELAAASLQVERAKADLRWSGRLGDPELEVSLSDDALGHDEGERNFEVALRQEFPFTSRLRDEKRLRHHQVVLAEAEIAERRRQVAGQVDLAAVELVATQEVLGRQRRLVGLNDQITSFLKVQADQGQASQLDVTQAQLTGQSLQQRAGALAAEARARRLALAQRMGLSPDTPVTITDRLTLPGVATSSAEPAEAVLLRRPDYLLALAKIDEADATVALERSRRWEDFGVKVFGEWERVDDEPAGLDTNAFVGVGISVPLPLRQRNQAGVERALIDREAAARALDAARFAVRSEHAAALESVASTWALASEASGEVLALAGRNFEEFQAAYQAGQASLLQVQRAQEQQLEAETAAAEAAASFHRAEAHLRFVTGAYPGLDGRPTAPPK